jgi:hypothetical protein
MAAIAMKALARVLTRVSVRDVADESLEAVLVFSAVGLAVSLLFAAYGLDLSPGFF